MEIVMETLTLTSPTLLVGESDQILIRFMSVSILQRYTISMDFVRKFDRQCGSQASVRRLRAHASYQSFHNKWNLPVYFQLR